MLAVVLSTLAKLVVILKLGLRNTSQRITRLIILNIYTLPQHSLTSIIFFLLKYLIKITLNWTGKLTKLYILAGQIQLRCKTKSFRYYTFTVACATPLFLSALVFSLSSIIFIVSDSNYRHLLLS